MKAPMRPDFEMGLQKTLKLRLSHALTCWISVVHYCLRGDEVTGGACWLGIFTRLCAWGNRAEAGISASERRRGSP